jgi:hypothetical protein
VKLIHKIIQKITIAFFLALAILMIPFSISKFFNLPIYIDEKLIPLFNEFKKDNEKYKAGASYYKLTTTFAKKLPTGIAAYCRPVTNTVVVSSEVWDRLSTQGRKALLYHEWAHCTLRRDHTTDLMVPFNSCPRSIMYPYVDNVERCFDELEEEYIEELFTNPYNYEKFSRGI